MPDSLPYDSLGRPQQRCLIHLMREGSSRARRESGQETKGYPLRHPTLAGRDASVLITLRKRVMFYTAVLEMTLFLCGRRILLFLGFLACSVALIS